MSSLGPIEVYWIILVVIFGLIGLVRGFLRELGVTTILVFVLFFLHQFSEPVERGLVMVSQRAQGLVKSVASNNNAFLAAMYIVFLTIVAFISYHGETLAFEGTPPRGGLGISLALMVGLINGYLISGSIWYYVHKYGYPFSFMGVQTGELSSLAQKMVQYLPYNLLGREALFGQSLLLYISVILLLGRVVR